MNLLKTFDIKIQGG